MKGWTETILPSGMVEIRGPDGFYSNGHITNTPDPRPFRIAGDVAVTTAEEITMIKSAMQPTMELRFVERKIKSGFHKGPFRVLQQKWYSPYEPMITEWRDVPLTEDSP